MNRYNLPFPEEIENIIMNEYLKKCELCNRLNCKDNSDNCKICNRYWCNSCIRSTNYLKKSYFEVYIMTCKNCLYDLKTSKIV